MWSFCPTPGSSKKSQPLPSGRGCDFSFFYKQGHKIFEICPHLAIRKHIRIIGGDCQLRQLIFGGSWTSDRFLNPLFLFDAVSEYSPSKYREYWDISLNCAVCYGNRLSARGRSEGSFRKNLHFAYLEKRPPNCRGPPFRLNFLKIQTERRQLNG